MQKYFKTREKLGWKRDSKILYVTAERYVGVFLA
jgi:hypothetical protein